MSTATTMEETMETTNQTEETSALAPRRRVNPVLLGAVGAVLLAAGLGWYSYAQKFESTDDAQVDGHLIPITARIDGTIKAVSAEDNQTVQAGALLVELDPSENTIALQQSQAQYNQAQAQLDAAHPNLPMERIDTNSDLATHQSDVTAAEATLSGAQHDLESTRARLRESEATNEQKLADYQRDLELYNKQEIARADFDHARTAAAAQQQTVASNQAAVASAERTVELRNAQLASSRSKLQQTLTSAPLQIAIRQAEVKSHQANVEANEAALAQSHLNLDYCRIPAPVHGVVTQRSAEVGARISKGQQLMMLVQTDDLWVTANFKETQLAHMRSGQSVRIHVDALQRDFNGTVESMPAVTGARTSVLPPENATGNYVKVIQRLPVRIRFTSGQPGLDLLRPGMSVEPKVRVD
ncbi:HlyD family secretion protein [Telmatobacter bradus]|uniref:HlyD family secretion protein n=1 Tax=Telmatobacter bradus TaxID=474953 RepID=UPI003B43CBBC